MRRALALVLALSCATPKLEVSALATSVEFFHRASNDERPSRADAIAKVVCQDADVCAAKTACVEATAATADALRLKQHAETLLSEVEDRKLAPDDESVRALPAELDRASILLKKGHDAMPACDQKILVLRERYGL
jgi:hypothetical protein